MCILKLYGVIVMPSFLNTKSYKVHDSCIDICSYAYDYSMLSYESLQVVYEIAVIADMLDGDAAEAGVYKGGASYVLASVLTNKILHCFDSWEGLPELHKFDMDLPDDCDIMQSGWGKTDPPYGLLSKFGDRVKLHQGWFSDTLNNCKDTLFCLVHIDVDRYMPAKECLEFFYPKIVKNGFIVMDDYMYACTPGVTKAVDDFFGDKMNNINTCRYGSKLIIKAL